MNTCTNPMIQVTVKVDLLMDDFWRAGFKLPNGKVILTAKRFRDVESVCTFVRDWNFEHEYSDEECSTSLKMDAFRELYVSDDPLVPENSVVQIGGGPNHHRLYITTNTLA